MSWLNLLFKQIQGHADHYNFIKILHGKKSQQALYGKITVLGIRTYQMQADKHEEYTKQIQGIIVFKPFDCTAVLFVNDRFESSVVSHDNPPVRF